MSQHPIPFAKDRVDAEIAWRFLLALRASDVPPGAPPIIGFDGNEIRVGETGPILTLRISDGGRTWRSADSISTEAADFLDLYLPLCLAPPGRPYVVAHLGQSLDGRIATENGVSKYVTGPENIVHMHRLRALSDAVVVGAGTVAHDDPQLTTRAVDGPNPIRVVIDPARRLPGDLQLFTDGAAPTLLVCCEGESAGGAVETGSVETLVIPSDQGRISAPAILDALGQRGCRRVFIEGGGVTISHFLEKRLIDRLQLTVAPIILGSGRSAIGLPAIASLDDALRPRVRQHVMGNDIMYDCDFVADPSA